MDLRKSLLKVAIGIAMLMVIGSFYAGRETPEPIAPTVYRVSVSNSLTADDVRALLSDFSVNVRQLQPSQGERFFMEVIAVGNNSEIETRLTDTPGIQIIERTEGSKAQ